MALIQPLFKKKVTINDLSNELDYMPADDIAKIHDAYEVAVKAHHGQYRSSGESYVLHPLSVAMILAKLQLDCCCIVAALLHDCIEDTSITKEEIEADFGKEVAHIVEGVSKLKDLESHSVKDKQAQNFIKLLLAMSSDMRVIIIKLADRLHNMRTIKSLPKEKQLRISKETAEIHAPIARRLGLNGIKIELDNLCFEITNPNRYRIITSIIKKQYGNRKRVIRHIIDEIYNRFKQEGMTGVTITGRKKQPCSVYEKMKLKKLKFSQVLDMYAFRVIVEDVSQCYQALGIIHNLYKPLPGKFKDYIALPKSNGYQSLHTVLFGPSKIFVETQIRSKDMHFISEYGIAAHWHYKTKDKLSNIPEANNWLISLLEIQKKSNTSMDFLEETKIDLFPTEVFVFTPTGDIIQLPNDSTVLDFAYAVHTKIGNRTIGAKIDKTNVNISTKIKSGQTIEIITKKGSKPDPSWLQIVVTAKARSSINAKLKSHSTAELILLGKEILNNAFDYQNIDISKISKDRWQDCLRDFKCESKLELYIKIGLSDALVIIVLNKLQYGSKANIIEKINIKGTRGKAVSCANCCYPIPGDKVVGIINSNKGLVLHRFDCGNMSHAKQKKAQWMEVNWEPDEIEEFSVLINIQIESRRGMLASITNIITRMNITINSLKIEEKDSLMKALNVVIPVKNANHLQVISEKLQTSEFVTSVNRV